MRPEALLAIRSDIAASIEQDYLEWLTREHTLERVGIAGFLSARILRSRHSGFGRYLILYELADAGVVDSPAYLQRLNDPTPWTTRMMPHLRNFVRGGGTVTAALGAGYGGAVAAIMTQVERCTGDTLEALSRQPGIAAIRMLQTDTARTLVATSERELRSGDRSFEALLIVEALDEAAAKAILPTLTTLCGQESARDEIYAQIFSLHG